MASLENRILSAADVNKNGTDHIRYKQSHAFSDTHIISWLCSVTIFLYSPFQKHSQSGKHQSQMQKEQ